MDTKLYPTRIVIELEHVGTPDYIIRLDGIAIGTTIAIDLGAGAHCLEIEHLNKLSSDPTTALVIKSITFNDITSPKFVWAGIYEPKYPEPWATEQQNQGVVLKQHLCSHDNLGWNGKWTLTFTAPVFTWIHKTQDLGWIYG